MRETARDLIHNCACSKKSTAHLRLRPFGRGADLIVVCEKTSSRHSQWGEISQAGTSRKVASIH
jgi:hypothetical protein